MGDILDAFLNENKIVSTKDIYHNFNLWKPNTNTNVLLITGLSGSGKSTLAKQMADKYNAIYFTLDGFEHNFDYSGYNILDEYKKKYPELIKYFNNEWGTADNKTFSVSLVQFILFILNDISKKYKNRLIIIEGVQIYSNYNNMRQIKKVPIIIKGTSSLKSAYRQGTRFLDVDTPDGIGHGLKVFKHDNYLKSFIKDIQT